MNKHMELDPHTLQQILQRIQQQMRCPQCGKKVPIDFSNVRVVGDEAMLLQLRCEQCNAYIVLHASLQGVEHLSTKTYNSDATLNASTSLVFDQKEMSMLQAALEQSGGSFEALFKKYGQENIQKS